LDRKEKSARWNRENHSKVSRPRVGPGKLVGGRKNAKNLWESGSGGLGTLRLGVVKGGKL